MIIKNFEDIDINNFPVVIFGSGPAGISTAIELEKKNINSLIIEAGEEDYSEQSQEFYKGTIVGDQITDLSESRLRQFGGTVGHWGGWVKPMDRFNINNWNLDYEDLNLYHNRACEILKVNNIFRKAKIGDYFNQIEIQTSLYNTNEYKVHISKSKKIHLLLNTQLSHFVGNEKNTKYAVCISRNRMFNIKTKYFVLACGGIENSRILLWTKEKNSNFINKKLPIGKFWMNHPYILGASGGISRINLKKFLGHNFIEYEGNLHLATSNNLVNEKKILSSHIFMKFEEDLKLHKEIVRDILCVAPEYGNKIMNMIFKKDLQCGNIYLSLEEPAQSENKISLDNKMDLNNIPLVKLFYKKSIKSLETAKIALEELANFVRLNDLGRIGLKKNIYNMVGFDSIGAYHHLGGTRIGSNFNTSVVNANLKVHMINNLYINGSSNFSSGGYTNPTFTIVKFALRLAHHLDQQINKT